MGGQELIPTRVPWKQRVEQQCWACSKAPGAPDRLDFQCAHSARLLQAAGSAKCLTQASYISTATSLTDRGNLKNIDVPRSLFHKMVLIDTNDISHFQPLLIEPGGGRFTPQHRTDVSWTGLGHPVYSMEVQAGRQHWDPGGSPRDPQALIRQLLTRLLYTRRCVRPADLKI